MNNSNKANNLVRVILATIVFTCAAGFGITNFDGLLTGESQEIVEESADNQEAESAQASPKEKKAEKYKFRSEKQLDEHYNKHGVEMGFASAKDYESAASDVINNSEALHKTEKEDGDDVYYLEETNEFVILSKDGFIRTYFYPDAGINYYNKQ